LMAYQSLISAYTKAGETERAAETQKKLEERVRALSEARTKMDSQPSSPVIAE